MVVQRLMDVFGVLVVPIVQEKVKRRPDNLQISAFFPRCRHTTSPATPSIIQRLIRRQNASGKNPKVSNAVLPGRAVHVQTKV